MHAQCRFTPAKLRVMLAVTGRATRRMGLKASLLEATRRLRELENLQRLFGFEVRKTERVAPLLNTPIVVREDRQ